MTIQKNMLLSSLLLAGTYAYSMEKDNSFAETIKAQVKSHFDAKKAEVRSHCDAKTNKSFYTIPGQYMDIIISHKEIHDAFIILKKSERSESDHKRFNEAVDSYIKGDSKDDQ